MIQTDICEEAVFNFDLKKIHSVVGAAREVVAKVPGSKLYYSVKAQSDIQVLSTLVPLVDGFDVSSMVEYEKLNTISKRLNLNITGTSYTFEDISKVYKCGFIFNFDSEIMLNRFLESNKSKYLDIGIRVSTEYYDRTFGIEFNKRFQDLLLKFPNVSVTQLHVHFNEKNNLNKVKNVFKTLLDIAAYLKNNNMFVPSTINLGGGLDELFRTKSADDYFNLVNDFKKEYSELTNISPVIIFEPGELLVAAIATLSTSVIDIKKLDTVTQIVVNASKFNLLPWYSPRILDMKSQINSPLIRVKIFGFTNFPGDYFGEFDIPMEYVSVGSRITFKNTGAYSIGMERRLQGLIPPKITYSE